jgi:hypothetical protein
LASNDEGWVDYTPPEPVVPGREPVVPGREPTRPPVAAPSDGWADYEPPHVRFAKGFMDTLKSIGPGLANAEAGIVGFPGDIQSIIQAASAHGYNPADYLARKFEEAYPTTAAENKARAARAGLGEVPQLPTTSKIKGLTGLDKADYQPEYPSGEVMKGVMGNVLAPFMGGARTLSGIAGNATKFTLAPAVASTTAEKVAGNIDPAYAGPAGAVAGLIAPLVTHAGMSPFRFRGPADTEAAWAEKVADLQSRGFKLTPAQVSNNKQLRYAEAQLMPEQYLYDREASTRAATREVGNGQGGNYETGVLKSGRGGTLDKMVTEVGQRYERLNKRNTFEVDPDFTNAQAATVNKYTGTPGLYSPEVESSVNAMAKRVRDAIVAGPNHGQLTGENFHDLVTEIRDIARTTNNSEKAKAFGDLANNLSAGMERSIQRNNKADLGAYRETDRDYKNMKVLEHAITRAGSETHITPHALDEAANSVYGTRAHERGHDPFSWAPAAKEILRMAPDSGTSSHWWLKAINAGLGHTIGQAVSHFTGDPALMTTPLGNVTASGLSAPVGAAMLPLVEKPIYKAMSPYLKNQWTRSQDPLLSIPGLLSAEGQVRQ